jgi:hypothetical protein
MRIEPPVSMDRRLGRSQNMSGRWEEEIYQLLLLGINLESSAS